jgi:signal peptidase I
MAPNLAVGDIVKMDASLKNYDYGDMIVCYQKTLVISEYEYEYDISISRIVALPGDSIKIKHNRCIINGIENKSELIQEGKLESYGISYSEYEETFPNGKNVRILHSSDIETEESVSRTVVIPAGHFFIMGDHRGDSYDSRYFGPIPKENILGKVVEIKKKK